MKALIIYFSQTGNTRKMAESIRDGIVEVTGRCELKELGHVDGNSLSEYDLVGLGCPVFYCQEPLNIRHFIRGLPELNGRQWFIFCTHGSVIGNTLPSMAEQMREKGIVTIGYYHIYADGTLPFYPYPTLTTGHPDSIDLKDARAFGKEVARRSQRFAEGDRSLVPEIEPPPEEWVKTAEMLTPEFLAQTMPRLRIDMGKCTHCHVCEDNCPVRGIDIEMEPPRIQDPCIYCWNCAKICPTLAIQTDWDMLVAMAPENYARYRQALDEAAARGEFRWLIDPDSIDFENPLYKQRERELESKGKENS